MVVVWEERGAARGWEDMRGVVGGVVWVTVDIGVGVVRLGAGGFARGGVDEAGVGGGLGQLGALEESSAVGVQSYDKATPGVLRGDDLQGAGVIEELDRARGENAGGPEVFGEAVDADIFDALGGLMAARVVAVAPRPLSVRGG